MENMINQREEDINNIASLMQNINDIAKDIAQETANQGEKLVKLDQHMTTANENTEKALDELT